MLSSKVFTHPEARVYRRSAHSRAPRKRTYFMTVSKQGGGIQSTVPWAVAGSGNDGPNGPPKNPTICCWGNNDDSPKGDGSLLGKGLLGCMGAAAWALSVSCPHPATAASYLEVAAGSSSDFGRVSYSSNSFLTEEEMELLDPKQYRVREWVYVH